MSKTKGHGTINNDEQNVNETSAGEGHEKGPSDEIYNENGELMHKEKRVQERRVSDRRLKVETEAQGTLIDGLKKEVGIRDEEIQKLKEEIESMKDKSLRQLAEFDNYKKRNQKQQEYFKKFAIKDFALDIIVINDDLHRVLEASSSIKEGETFEQAHNSFVEGISMISRRIESSLNKYGIVEVEAQGQVFNPNFHEAVEIEQSGEFKCDTVTKVHQKGFRIDELVLRPAKVKVTKPLKSDASDGCPQPAPGEQAQGDNT